MMTTRLALAIAVLSGLDQNPSGLVHKLGAPKYADRQAASAALEKLGSAALPALRAAKVDRDAEIRSRAEVLVERIENDLLVRASQVVLDFQDRPLGEVIKELGARGRANLALVPTGGVSAESRRVTLTSPEPVPFWTAVEELLRAGDLEMSGAMPAAIFGQSGSRGTVINLFAMKGKEPRTPASVSGPFRVALLNLSYHKERNFGGNNPTNPGMIGMRGDAIPAGGFAGQAGMASSEQFLAYFLIMAEPRIAVTMNGPIRLIEAMDDRGNSLVPPQPSGNVFQQISGYNRFENQGSVALQATVPLAYPDQPGRTIKRIQGAIPLTVSSRKEGPLEIPLAEAKGKTYQNSEVSLTIHDVRPEPNFGQTSIELTVRSLDPNSSANHGVFAPEFQAVRSPGTPQNSFEIADAQGRLFPMWNVMSQMQGPDGLRVILRVSPQQGTGVPSQIRYYEMARVNTEAEFDFNDIAMP